MSKRDAADHMREEGADRFRKRVDEDIGAQHKSGKKNGNSGAAKPPRFALKCFDEIKMTKTADYLVKGLLPRSGLAVIWGPPKCGKSFWTFDLVMHVAIGRNYRAHRVHQGNVVYLALEGGSGFSRRIEAWRQRHLNDHDQAVPFFLIDVALDLVKDCEALIAAIRQQLGDTRPSCIVLDTLNRALRGDENSSADMAEFIRAADILRSAFDCLLLVIHHCGTAGTRPRGHTSLSGADELMKDDESGAVLTSRLERIELGTDTDGDPLSSCVITEADTVTKGPKLTQVQRFAFELLQRLIQTNSVEPPADADLPKGSRVVLAETWREEFMSGYPTGNRDSRKRMFNRGVLELDQQHLVVLWREFAWTGTAGTQ
jgi:hypothetical protein